MLIRNQGCISLFNISEQANLWMRLNISEYQDCSYFSSKLNNEPNDELFSPRWRLFCLASRRWSSVCVAVTPRSCHCERLALALSAHSIMDQMNCAVRVLKRLWPQLQLTASCFISLCSLHFRNARLILRPLYLQLHQHSTRCWLLTSTAQQEASKRKNKHDNRAPLRSFGDDIL